MHKPFPRTTAMLLILAAALLNLPSAAGAADAGFTTLDVNGEAVKIYRDDFGTPTSSPRPTVGCSRLTVTPWPRIASGSSN